MSSVGKKTLGRMQAVIVVLVVLIGWFSCVLGAAWGLAWLGPAVVAVLAALHLLYSRTWRRDLALMLGLGAFGAVFESLHVESGLVTYAGQGTSWLAPPWVLALWFHFGTMRHATLRLLFGRPLLAATSGALLAPLAYAGGAALGAARFASPEWRALAVIAVVWACVVPAASLLAWRGTALRRH